MRYLLIQKKMIKSKTNIIIRKYKYKNKKIMIKSTMPKNILSSQILKYGCNIGNSSTSLDNSNLFYIDGKKNKCVYINLFHISSNLKKMSLISKKIISKKSFISLRNSDTKDRYVNALNRFIVKNNPNVIKNMSSFEFGSLSNKEIRRSFLFLNKKRRRNVLSNSYVNIFNTFRYNKQKINSIFNRKKKKYLMKKFPSFMIMLKFNRRSIIEIKKKNILSSCLLDTNEFSHVSDYSTLYNNRSVASLSFMSRVLKT